MRFSVIVPVYNTEKYLDRCINSILSQRFSDFELILVDDGSLDGSLRICERYAQEDQRIHVFHKLNGGLADTRNYGMVNAKGDYIVFLDSDDWFEDQLLDDYQKLIEQSLPDVIIQGIRVDFAETGTDSRIRFEESKLYLSGAWEGVAQAEKNGLFNSSCNKAYLRKIIELNKLCFDVGKEPAEDLLFNCKYFAHVHSIGCLAVENYHYVKRQAATLTVKYIDNYEDRIIEYHEARKRLFNTIAMPTAVSREILNNGMTGYSLTAVSNLYRESSPLSFRDRTEAFKKLLNNNDVYRCVRMSTYSNVYLKIMKALFILRSAIICNLVFSLLYHFRYSFQDIYVRFRDHALYSKRR